MPRVRLTDFALKSKVVTADSQPVNLPTGINNENRLIATLTEGEKFTTGNFSLISVVQSRLSSITEGFGERIQGILSINSR